MSKAEETPATSN